MTKYLVQFESGSFLSRPPGLRGWTLTTNPNYAHWFDSAVSARVTAKPLAKTRYSNEAFTIQQISVTFEGSVF